MSLTPTLDIGDLIKFVCFLLSGLFFIWRMSGRLDLLAGEIKALQDVARMQTQQIGEFSKALIDLARQDERIAAVDRRVEDLRHGRGWVQPDINGEYASAGRRPV